MQSFSLSSILASPLARAGLFFCIGVLPTLSAWSLTVAVSGPLPVGNYAEYRLSIVNDDGGATYDELETDWVYRMADILYRLKVNRDTFDSAVDQTTSWQLGIVQDSPVSNGWFVSRGPTAVFIRHGAFGWTQWSSTPPANRVIVSIQIPQDQIPDHHSWDDLNAAAHYTARTANNAAIYQTNTPVLAFPSTPPHPRLRFEHVSETALMIAATGEAGFRYRLEGSTDLHNWIPVGDWISPANGELEWIGEFGDEPCGFFRLIVKPE